MNIRWKIAQFFEKWWWKRYLKPKNKTEYLDWKRAYWIDFLRRADIQVPTTATVLDAGCGPAGIFMVMPENTTAIDPLLSSYEGDLPHFRRTDYPKVHFVETTLEDYIAPQPFDYVFCLNAINHVADLPLALDRLTATCTQGGTLAMSIDAHRYQLLKHVFRLVPGDILHPHQYDLQEYTEMLTSRGYSLINTLLMKEEGIFNYWLLVGRLKKPN